MANRMMCVDLRDQNTSFSAFQLFFDRTNREIEFPRIEDDRLLNKLSATAANPS